MYQSAKKKSEGKNKKLHDNKIVNKKKKYRNVYNNAQQGR